MPSQAFPETLDDLTEAEVPSIDTPRWVLPAETTFETVTLSEPLATEMALLNVRTTPFLIVSWLHPHESTTPAQTPLPRRTCPLRSIVIPDEEMTIPCPAQARSWVRTAFVVTVCPQAVIGVHPALTFLAAGAG